MKKNKKGISGVIAVSLILIIAVMSILQFQIWLEGYSQNIFNNVEMQNKDLEKNNFKINTIISNQLYLTNNLENDVEIKDVKLNSIDCNIHTNITHGTESISIKECLNKTNTSQIDVTVITQNNIYDKYIYSPKELEKSNNILTPPIEVGLSMVWNKSFYAKQSSDTMYNPNIQIDSSDNLYILGEEQTYSLIAKYNEDGQQIWNFTLPNPSYNIRINNLVIDNNNNFFYIVGSDSNKMFVSKYDLSGSNVWNKTYGVSDDETETYGLTVGQDGYLYVSGKKKEFSDHTNYYTIKLDNLGNIIGTLETNINSYESGSMTMPVDQEMTEEIKINNIGSKYIINREPSILIKLNNID